jgi:hypothetical protein
MRVHEMIVAERQHMADLLASLSQEQLARQSLCDAWTVHLDVRIPLGIDRAIPEDRLAVTFHHLASAPSPGFAVGGRLSGLRFEAVDTGWTSGRGAPVRGDAEAIVLAMAGRTIAWPRLDGDGAAVLSERVNQAPGIPVAQRLAKLATTVLRPSPRRARHLGPPPLTPSSPDG